jgi:CRISPR-associated protein Csd2
MTQENILKKRYDFVLLFDVKDGNPNGDPDAGNLPRLDAQTGNGLVTDVCLKRKIRNFIQLEKQGIEGYDIFVKSKEITGMETFLNAEIKKGYDELKIDLETKNDLDGKKRKNNGEAQGKEIDLARRYLCEKFYDIRTFGAVLSTGPKAGQVRGPVQMTFARSCDPIVSSEHTLTVCAARDENKGFEEQTGIQGRKYTVPYALYRAHGFISAHLAAQTGFTTDDLDVFWEALEKMFWEDHSAARGEMNVRGLYIFEHSTALGNASAHELFERVKITRKNDSIPPRSFDDYKVDFDTESMPEGVNPIPKIG